MIKIEMYLLLGFLFFILSPGVLLTLPPVGRNVFLSGKTSLLAVAVHTLVFYLLLKVCSYFSEGFQTADASDSTTPRFDRTANLLPLGATCKGDAKCFSGHCIDGVCKQYVEFNGICNTNSLCGTGLTCVNNKCVNMTTIGSPCDANNVCPGSATCNSNICKLIGLGTNAACNWFKMCNSDFADCSGASQGLDASGNYTNGFCKNKLASTCTANSDCFSNECVNGVCSITLTNYGDDCKSRGTRCGTGLACDRIDKICKQGVGSDCSKTSTKCSSGLTCQNKVCVNRNVGINDACDGVTRFCGNPFNTTCSNGFCKILLGKPCGDNAECQSGRCSANKCI
jgi:hypothetical protein